jgi:HTH-type transcriptional regulator/antitoxin HigA
MDALLPHQVRYDVDGWSQRLLAIVLGMDETGVNRIVANKRPIDAPLALTLEEVFRVPAERFLDLQKSYDLALARIEVKPDPERATRARLYGDLPVSEMIKRGWIKAKDVRDPLVRSELMRFFQANRIEDIEILPHAAKKTSVKWSTYDQDHWNAQHPSEEPIQLPLDLTFDIELKKNMPDKGEEEAA